MRVGMPEQREVAEGQLLQGTRDNVGAVGCYIPEKPSDISVFQRIPAATPTPAGGGPNGTTGTRYFLTLNTVKTFMIFIGFHPQCKKYP